MLSAYVIVGVSSVNQVRLYVNVLRDCHKLMFVEVWVSLGIGISLVSLAHASCCYFLGCFLTLPFLSVQNLSQYWVWVKKT